MSNNLEMINNLLNFLNLQPEFIEYKNKYLGAWINLLESEQGETFVSTTVYFNSKFKDTFANKFLPLLQEEDHIIGILRGKYVSIDWEVIHALGKIEERNFYSTPKEVWEKVIKPDIDNYYAN
jgi:hypothetical protein